MPHLRFHIVDVFAEQKYAGNQLAVFLRAGSLSVEEMQSIAQEINFSETTFVRSDGPRQGGYDVRIFTPKREVPFAGHPTLGTAFVIQREIIGHRVGEICLNLDVGPIPVTFSRDTGADVLWMQQNAPEFGETIQHAEIADILGLDESDIDHRYPVQDVSTGLWFVIVPVTSLGAIKQARIVRDKYFPFVANRQAKGLLLFCPETYDRDNDLNVRMFDPCDGIEEDAATGSGNGCLAAYMVEHRYFGGDSIELQVEQGCEMNRPSLLHLLASRSREEITVGVGGKVAAVASGQWLIEDGIRGQT